MNEIYYWADGTWCYKCEYNSSDYGWKSDDFGRVDIRDNILEEDIQIIVDKLVT